MDGRPSAVARGAPGLTPGVARQLVGPRPLRRLPQRSYPWTAWRRTARPFGGLWRTLGAACDDAELELARAFFPFAPSRLPLPCDSPALAASTARAPSRWIPSCGRTAPAGSPAQRWHGGRTDGHGGPISRDGGTSLGGGSAHYISWPLDRQPLASAYWRPLPPGAGIPSGWVPPMLGQLPGAEHCPRLQKKAAADSGWCQAAVLA